MPWPPAPACWRGRAAPARARRSTWRGWPATPPAPSPRSTPCRANSAAVETGPGDIAMTLANVRRLSGTAATIDVGSVNGILRDTNAMIARNQENIAAMLADTRGASAQTRTMLEELLRRWCRRAPTSRPSATISAP
ncbi:hypothetical protein AB5I41_12125 [Sphingomonas sp. MMS24-JH45]